MTTLHDEVRQLLKEGRYGDIDTLLLTERVWDIETITIIDIINAHKATFIKCMQNCEGPFDVSVLKALLNKDYGELFSENKILFQPYIISKFIPLCFGEMKAHPSIFTFELFMLVAPLYEEVMRYCMKQKKDMKIEGERVPLLLYFLYKYPVGIYPGINVLVHVTKEITFHVDFKVNIHYVKQLIRDEKVVNTDVAFFLDYPSELLRFLKNENNLLWEHTLNKIVRDIDPTTVLPDNVQLHTILNDVVILAYDSKIVHHDRYLLKWCKYIQFKGNCTLIFIQIIESNKINEYLPYVKQWRNAYVTPISYIEHPYTLEEIKLIFDVQHRLWSDETYALHVNDKETLAYVVDKEWDIYSYKEIDFVRKSIQIEDDRNLFKAMLLLNKYRKRFKYDIRGGMMNRTIEFSELISGDIPNEFIRSLTHSAYVNPITHEDAILLTNVGVIERIFQVQHRIRDGFTYALYYPTDRVMDNYKQALDFIRVKEMDIYSHREITRITGYVSKGMNAQEKYLLEYLLFKYRDVTILTDDCTLLDLATGDPSTIRILIEAGFIHHNHALRKGGEFNESFNLLHFVSARSVTRLGRRSYVRHLPESLIKQHLAPMLFHTKQ